MQFAINWSPEAAALLSAGKIQLDLYKCPDWADLVADARSQLASYVHFPLQVGCGQSGEWDLAQLENWLAQSETIFVNCHIMPRSPDIPADSTLDETVDLLAREIDLLVQRFGADRVIIENAPFMERHIEKGYLRHGANPLLFQHLTQATGCGFLLDISHATLTCEFTGADLYAYLNTFPTMHLRELHVTGIGTWTTGIRGDHLPLQVSDWERLAWCTDQIRGGAWRVPDVVAFEYGGIGRLRDLCGCDGEAIAEQAPRLYAIAHGLLPVSQ